MDIYIWTTREHKHILYLSSDRFRFQRTEKICNTDHNPILYLSVFTSFGFGTTKPYPFYLCIPVDILSSICQTMLGMMKRDCKLLLVVQVQAAKHNSKVINSDR
jgi:hypothetical protein